jgi:LPPG:FO 2-phospho-L-lactate transferase
VVETLCDRWDTGGVRLLPATDDRLETHVVVDEPERAIHFQEWWVRYRAGLPARRFVFVGADKASAAPGVLDAIQHADIVLVAPSNPVVSIAPVLAVTNLRNALVTGPAPVSPIIGGAPVRGMADKCLAALDVPVTAAGVGNLYGARSSGGVLDAWLVDGVDTNAEVKGVTVRVAPLWMTDEKATVEIVAQAMNAVEARA